MDSTDLSVLRAAIDWLRAGRRVALATVVETWGSAPRRPGAWLAIRDDGQVVGSVSGGCVEDDLIARVREGALQRELPELVVYGATRDDASRFNLPCGGRLRIVVEPRPRPDLLEALLARTAAKRITTRSLDMATGASSLADAARSDVFSFDGRTMRAVHGPRWRLVVIGAGQLSRCVCEIALAADYEIVVVDPREEFAEGMTIEGVSLLREMPDDAILALGIDDRTAIVALTHDPKLDDMALLEALKSPAFYVGALGSRATTASRRARLAMFDMTPEEIDRLHGPIGLFIGARTPPEIAISILAEITAVRHGVPLLQRRREAPAGAD
ncbi:XdhC family protein [Burkholderiaceae bacterium FT117]|uniref:XdhC family protein n=1 Tax=Zeimonas sediminis TaxID=2944268 RepID=UPI002342CE6A|nr:XdhC family protein [Zeimonas sediminis]MCM5570127.1 XdhC family protein [Zeimonas sediminis]